MVVFVLPFSYRYSSWWIVASRINIHKLLLYHRSLPKYLPKNHIFPFRIEKGINTWLAHCHFETNRTCQLFQMWQKCGIGAVNVTWGRKSAWCSGYNGGVRGCQAVNEQQTSQTFICTFNPELVSSCTSIILGWAEQGEAPAPAVPLTQICGSGSQLS